jgi:hypothetical protein
MIRGRLRAALVVGILASAAAGSAACDVNVGEGGFNLGLASGKATDEWTRTYTVAPNGRFTVRNDTGPVTNEPSTDAKTVEVRAERTARASSDEAAKALLGNIQIVEDVKPDAIRIETKAPKSSGRSGHEIKYFIKVPAGVVVEARTVNGGVRVNNVPNDVTVESVNGGVRGSGISGHLDANTTNGGIEVDVDALADAGVKLATVNGGVELTLPKAAKANISARVTNGGLHTGDLPIETTGEKNRRRLEGTLNGGGSPVELATTNGGIHLAGK